MSAHNIGTLMRKICEQIRQMMWGARALHLRLNCEHALNLLDNHVRLRAIVLEELVQKVELAVVFATTRGLDTRVDQVLKVEHHHHHRW